MNLSVLLCSDSMFLIGMLVNAETYNYLTSEQSTERISVASMVYACNFKSITRRNILLLHNCADVTPRKVADCNFFFKWCTQRIALLHQDQNPLYKQ